MPKATLQQIKPEKRERVLGEAARFFAERGYAQADMSELADRAGVAKGSLYNYFESKEDCYLTVCRDGLERSRQAVYGGIDESWDVFRQTAHVFRAGIAFARKHPEYVTLYLNTSSAGLDRFADEVSRDVEAFTADHLKRLLREGIEAGIVRADLDVPLAAYLTNSLYIMLLASIVSRHYQIRLSVYLGAAEDVGATTFDQHAERTIAFIHDCLRPRQGG